MKLKFKGEAKDFAILAVFALGLLYIVAIAVSNIVSVASYGEFAGLNPLLAFKNGMAGYTVLCYVIALGALFASVKSFFFDVEKGFGISFGKDEKGYSRWAKEKEMKADLAMVDIKENNYQHAGIPLINDGTHMWVDDGEAHNIVIGTTGSGKTWCVVNPMVKALARKGESMIITDPKAEIYRENIGLLKEKGYNVIVLNFREPQRGNMWNPLALPYSLYKSGNTDKAMELLDDVALNILYEGNSSDPFWEKTSADYFVGLALGLFEDGKEEEININSISVMTSVGDERFGGNSTYIKEYFNMKDPAGASYTAASGTVFAPNETKGGIISTFKQKIRLFASRENLSEMLSRSDFDINSIGKQKTAVFMVIQDEKKTYHALATIFVKQCYEALIDVAMHSPKGELPVRTNFILDEFANMPPLKDITTMVTAARSRHIRLTMMIQNFAQLDQVYGKEDAQTIRSNCTNLVYLITTELSALEEISKLCGEVKSKKDDKTASTPLVTVSDLQKLKKFECIILRLRMNPFKTRLTPSFEIDWGKNNYPMYDFIQREKEPIKVFDIREFVKEKKKSKIMDMLDNSPREETAMPNTMPRFPFMNREEEDRPRPAPFNVDDLVKKIDAKIAELEEEERQEKQNAKVAPITETKEEVKEEPVIVSKPVVEETVIEKPVVEQPITTPVLEEVKEERVVPPFATEPLVTHEVTDVKVAEDINNNEVKEEKTDDKSSYLITDDQFFDDFFD